MIVLVSEKPEHTRAIGAAAARKWAGHEIFALHTLYFSMTAFQYPRGRSWKDFPLTDFARYSIRADAPWSIYRIDAEGGAHRLDVVDGRAAAVKLLSEADEIVCAAEADPAGVAAYRAFLSCLIGYERATIERPAVFLTDYSAAAVDVAFENVQSTEGETFRELLDYGETKRYFDYNFNVNSLAILGKTLKVVSNSAAPVPMSKYALQTLYFLRRCGPMTETELLSRMYAWEGTGRYPGQRELGSPASRTQILDDLCANELTSMSAVEGRSRAIRLTALGQRFLDALHPDCEDPDLPFRLDRWCTDGLVKSGASINTYMRTFFGKQKRYLDRE